jgi:hypothetical protein
VCAPIRSDERNAIELDAELVCGELDERRLDALPQLYFACEDRDAPVPGYADPGIEHRGAIETARQAHRLGRIEDREQREAHHERAAACQKAAPGDGRIFVHQAGPGLF